MYFLAPPAPKKSDDLHSELVKRVSATNLGSTTGMGGTFYITKFSEPEDVKEWLKTKGFSRR